MNLPFLTILDPQAAIVGSRDPLGLQPVWARLGRQLVVNLTTVATSVRGYTTLLLGLYLADRLLSETGEEEGRRLGYFLRLEQMVAFSRFAHRVRTGDDVAGIRGIRRVQRRWEAGVREIRPCLGPDEQILSDQKTYGLWGLFSVPARDSGLRDRLWARPTAEARAHLESRLANLTRGTVDHLLRHLRQEQPFRPESPLGAALADLHTPKYEPAELDFYETTLLFGAQGGEGRQARLWRALAAVNGGDREAWARPFDRVELLRLIDEATRRGDDDVVERLVHIRDVEAVLAPTGAVFDALRGRHGWTLTEAARDFERGWGVGVSYIDLEGVAQATLRLDGAGAPGTADRLLALAGALRRGDYVAVISAALDQNRAVMAARGAGPWITAPGGMLDVRFRDDSAPLVDASSRPDWVNPYYLGALKHVGGTLLGHGLHETEDELE